MGDQRKNKANEPVLVVDDDTLQLKLLARLLEVENLLPICCPTGREALAACRQQMINVAILDLQLPDIDGLELLKQLRDQNPHIKVIINTAYPSLESAMMAVNEEAFAYVKKMGSAEELLAHIHRAFHAHLADYNAILESEVSRRTEALLKANEELKNEIAERKWVETALRQSQTRLKLLSDIATGITSGMSVEQVIQRAVKQIGEYFPTLRVTYSIIDEQGILTVMNSVGPPEMSPLADLVFDLTVAPEYLDALQQREPIVVNDLTQDPRLSPLLDMLVSGGARASLDVPLHHSDDLVGLLCFDSPEPHPWSGHEVATLAEVAEYLSIAVKDAYTQQERQRAEAALARRAREMGTLYETSLEINTQLDLSDLLEAIVRRATQLLGTETGGLFLLQPEAETLELVAGYNQQGEYHGITLRIGEGLTGRVAQTGQALSIPDYAAWEGHADLNWVGPIGRILGVPLKQGERVIGVLNVFDAEKSGSFTGDQIRLLDMLAAQAATSIEKARLLEAEREQRLLAETLTEVTLALASQINHTAVLDEILQQVQRLVPYKTANIMLLEGETLHIAGWQGYKTFGGEKLISNLVQPLADFPVEAEAVQSRKPVIIGDTHRDPRWVVFEETAWIRSSLVVPICLHECVLGLLRLDGSTPGEFSTKDIERLQPLANAAAIALENARLFEAEHQQRELAEALREVGTALSATLDFEVVLDRLLDQIARVVPYDAANVTLIKDRWVYVTRMRGYEQFGSKVAHEVANLSLEIASIANLRWMAETGRPLVIPDIAVYPGWVPVEATAYLRSWAGAPIISQGEVIAFFSLDKIEPNFYQPADAERLAAFAGQAAIALKNARLFEQTQAALAKTEALYRAGRSLIAFKNLPEILQAVVDGVAAALPADCVLLHTMNLQKRQVIDFVKGGPGSDQIPRASFEELWAGLSGWVMREQKPALSPRGSPDLRESPDVQRIRAAGTTGSIIVVPLQYWGRVLGTMTAINHVDQADFTGQDMELMVAMANQAAIAIENTRLFDETYRRAQQLATLNGIARVMTGLLDLEALCDTVVRRLHSTFGYSDVAVYIADPTIRQVVLQAVAGVYVSTLTPGEYRQAFGEGVIGQVAETGQFLVLNDVRQYPDSLSVGEVEINSELAIPLKVGQQVIGVFNIGSDQLNAFDENDVATLMTVADQLAVALEKARLFNETRRRAEQLEALRQVSQDLAALRDLDTLLHHIVERSLQLVGGDSGGIYLYRPERQVLEWVTPVGEGVNRPGITLSREEGLAGKVWATGKPIIVDNYQKWPGKSSQWDNSRKMAIIGVPIQWGDEFLGVLIQADSMERRFAPEDATLLSQFATQAAIAIQNARLHQATRKQARQVQQILDTVSEGILLLDSEHRVQLANPAARIYLSLLAGVSEGETLTHLAGQPLVELLISPAGGHWHEVVLDEASSRLFEVAAQPMQAGAETEGWVMILRDVTEERKIQERIQQQDRLAAVGQLAAGIAHDFNNILTSIIGYAELVRLDPDISTLTRDDLGLIVQQGERAAYLIRQILDFSRRSIIERRPIDLAPFLKETVKLLERTIPEDIRIELKVEPDREAYMLRADPAQIQQAMTNLAVNARDVMPAGGVLQFRLSHFTLYPDDPPPSAEMLPGDWVVLSVSDTGTGVLPEHRPHLFEPFFTTKEVGQGTGLGLAQVYGIVKQHEGHIEVESEVGQGTTFTLYLPALSLLSKARSTKATLEVPFGHGEVILLVEDDVMVLEVTKTMLERLDYRVLIATNGREALEVYNQHQVEIALVLTDVTMPELGGMALSQTLRDRGAAIKVIALTGYPMEAGAKDLLDQGIVDWLQKPLNFKQLAEIVSRSLKAEN